MSELRLAPEAETELDGMWLYIARESGSADLATRAVESITERFWLLSRHPYIGRRRDDLRPGMRSLPASDYLNIYRVENDDLVLVLHILHGSRDFAGLLGQ